jgi:acetyl-CoA carboxylase carboxyl transferase subunit beta
MSGPVVCVGAVAVDDERLLLVRRRNPPGAGRWSVPGGRVGSGETLAEAVVRELAEETGLEGICGELVGFVERIDGSDHLVILDFFVEVLEPDGLRPGSDASEAAWIALHEVAEQPLVEGLAEFLHENGVVDTIV